MNQLEKLSQNSSYEEVVEKINQLIDLIPLDCSCAQETLKSTTEDLSILKLALADLQQSN